MKPKNVFYLLFLMALVGFTSCATIQPSTVKLSSEVGNRLNEMEHLHQLALQRYFDSEKQKIENFLENEWEPLFLRNFLGTSGILHMLENVSRIGEHEKELLSIAMEEYITDTTKAKIATDKLIQELNKARAGEPTKVKTVLTEFLDTNQIGVAAVHLSSLLGSEEPAMIILEFAEAAHEEMTAQRREMLAPLEQARTAAVAQLSSAYADLIKGQSTITGRLDAASKLSNEQGKILNMFGVKNKAAGLLNKLTGLGGQVDQLLIKAKKDLKIQSLNDGNGSETDNISAALQSQLSGLFGSKKVPIGGE